MKKIKPIIQRDFMDCGICSILYIMEYYDGYVSLEKLREDTYTDNSGTSAYHIVKCFQKWGFDASGVLEHDITSNKLSFPLIAHVIIKDTLKHFVVIKKIDNKFVYLMDPSFGNKKMLIEEFQKIFTGNVIMAYPHDKIIKMSNNITISDIFINIIKKEKFLILKIIMTSLLWTFFLILSSYYLKIGSNFLLKDISIIKYLVLCFFVITTLKILCNYIKDYYINHLNNIVDVYLYPDFLKHLFFLPLKNIKTRSTGDIVTRINDLGNIKNLFSEIFVTVILESMMFISSIVILFIINKELFIILIIAIVIYSLLSLTSNKFFYKKIINNISYSTDFNSIIVESIENIESLKNVNVINNQLKNIEYYLSRLLYSNYEISSFMNIVNLLKNYILDMSIFVINSYGFFKVYNNNLSIVDLFTFNIVLAYFIDPIKNILNILTKFNYIKGVFSKISDFLNIDEEKIDNNHVYLKGDIIFENVSYTYNNYDYILKNISFRIDNNCHILLKGASGSGKSTICKLLYKEIDNNIGKILIGNVNIADLNISEIRDNIVYISQNEGLFSGTIRDNIIFGREVLEEDFFNMCEICLIDDIVSKRKLRYDSLIDFKSKNISGGEKQRIILARGLLKNGNIIILDEALSEVDLDIEKKIINNIKNYYKNKTIIYISHKEVDDCFKEKIELENINGLLQS